MCPSNCLASGSELSCKWQLRVAVASGNTLRLRNLVIWLGLTSDDVEASDFELGEQALPTVHYAVENGGASKLKQPLDSRR